MTLRALVEESRHNKGSFGENDLTEDARYFLGMADEWADA